MELYSVLDAPRVFRFMLESVLYFSFFANSPVF